MKEIFKNAFSMWFKLPYKEIGNVLLGTFKWYLLVLVLYLTFVILGFTFFFLCGGNFVEGFLSFTRDYFYDGYLLYFIAWKVHLTWFVICFFIYLNEEL